MQSSDGVLKGLKLFDPNKPPKEDSFSKLTPEMLMQWAEEIFKPTPSPRPFQCTAAGYAGIFGCTHYEALQWLEENAEDIGNGWYFVNQS